MPCNSYVCMLYGICYYYTLYDDDLPFGSLLSCNSTVGKENELNNSRTTSSSSDSEENFTDSDDNLSIDYSPISSSEPEDIIQQISIIIWKKLNQMNSNIPLKLIHLFWKRLHQSLKCHQLTNLSQTVQDSGR